MAVNIKNKKASYTYFLADEFTAGLVLSGSEIKSIRAGKASITESYCRFDQGELWVHNMYVAEYPNAGYMPQDSRRRRKLLLQRTELKKLEKKVKDVGVTLVPTLVSWRQWIREAEVFCGQRKKASRQAPIAQRRHFARRRSDDGLSTKGQASSLSGATTTCIDPRTLQSQKIHDLA